MYYVYELVNLLGGVEHVGKTIRPKIRFYEHVKNKPNKGKGKFYKRQDISMHIVATYATKAEALQAEYDLQIFWGLPTDRSKRVKGSKHWAAKLDETKVKEIKFLLSQKISCAEIGRRFSIPKRSISNIKLGHAWSHLN